VGNASPKMATENATRRGTTLVSQSSSIYNAEVVFGIAGTHPINVISNQVGWNCHHRLENTHRQTFADTRVLLFSWKYFFFSKVLFLMCFNILFQQLSVVVIVKLWAFPIGYF
jgi:hypothetical protein